MDSASVPIHQLTSVHFYKQDGFSIAFARNPISKIIVSKFKFLFKDYGDLPSRVVGKNGWTC